MGHAETAENTAPQKDGDSLKFNPDLYAGELRKRFRNSLGWAESVADKASKIALDVLLQTHGGRQQYLPKRIINHEEIRLAKTSGMKVEEISKTLWSAPLCP